MTSFDPPRAEIELSRVRALMISHLDNAGVSRVKILPAHKVASAATKGATSSISLGMLFSVDDYVNAIDEINPTVGDLRGLPDMSAVAMLDETSGLAWAPTDMHSIDGTVHPTCQRSTLKRVAASAQGAGIDFVVGMELEFTLFRGTKDEPELSHIGPGYGTLPFLELERFHLDLLTALESAGLAIEQLHPEYGDGQLELSLAARTPVRAVDEYLLARVIITRVALQHGFLASFAPVPVVGNISNGCHIHLSAQKDGANIFFDEGSAAGFTDDAGHMIAGILERLDEAVALLGGSTLSFERLRPHNWAGAYVCWGGGNREAAVRYMKGYAGLTAQQSNIEVKCADPAANHYLAVAMLIEAAMQGVQNQTPLPAEVLVEPGVLGESERALGKVRPFPADLGEALAMYEKSAFCAELLGPMLFSSYLAVRRHDWKVYGAMPVAEVAAAVRFRF